MSLNKQELKDLMLTVAKADRNASVAFSYGDRKFSFEQLNDALRAEIKELAGDYSSYRKNKHILFELMEEVVDLTLPVNVFENLKEFAEIKTFANGDKPYFKRRQSAIRGKNFVTRAAVGGVYEVFKLSSEIINIDTQSWGGAAQIGIEEFLNGSVDFAELLQIINSGFEQGVYKEVIRNMQALSLGGLTSYAGTLTNSIPAANNITVAGWAPVVFNNLLGITRAYGEPIIFCSPQFAYQIKPDNGWFATETDKEEIRNQGYVGRYNGARVVILPQSFYDVTNTAAASVVPAGYAWILPANEKPVKIAFEGDTVIEEFQNRDWSKEIQVYKKFGVVMIAQPGICVYRDTSLEGNFLNTSYTGPIFSWADGAISPTYTRMVF